MPDDTDIDRLQLLADWMRSNGVLGVRLPDSTELRLDPSWTPQRDTIPVPEVAETKTPEEKMKELALLRATQERRPFRHVRR